MNDRIERLRAITAQVCELAKQERELQDQFWALEPSMEELVDSRSPGPWLGPYVHYDQEHDIMHAYFDDVPAVTIWRKDGVCVQVARDDRTHVVGVTFDRFRSWCARQVPLREGGEA